jgi:hypothetical protein
MASFFVTSIVEGQWFYVTDATPVATIPAPRGSLAIRTDVGNESVWINTTVGGAAGTNWARIISPDINGNVDFTSVDQLTLADNANPALDIGSTGLLNLLRFITTNGAEQVAYNGIAPFLINTGGLNVVAGTVTFPNNTVNVATAAIAAGNEVVAASLTLRVTHPGGAVTEPVVLPVRAGGWRVLDAMVVASAAGGGGSSVQVQTVAAAAVSSVLTIDGAVVAGSVVRTTSLLNTVFASGATINVVGVGTPAASNVFITLAPL